jgi:hypothetical protein
MSRTVAVIWHALFSIAAGVLYFMFVLPRWSELSGETSHTFGTVLRIVAGALIGLAALPVVFTWLRTRRPEYGTPQLALRLRLSSVVLHVLGGVLIIGAAISEIWLSLDEAGPWLFGVYGGAAAIALLGIFSFYLAFIAELSPPPPRPLKKKERKSRWRRKGKEADATTGDESKEAEESDESKEAAETVVAENVDLQKDDAPPELESDAIDETAETAKTDEAGEDEIPAAELPRGGLLNRRPSGKLRRPRLRRKSGGVAVED